MAKSKNPSGEECIAIETQCDVASETLKKSFLENVTMQVNRVLTDPLTSFAGYMSDYHKKQNPELVEEVREIHDKTWRRLINFIMEMGDRTAYTEPNGPYKYLRGMSSDLQAQFGIPDEARGWLSHPLKAKDTMRYINEIIDLTKEQMNKTSEDLMSMWDRMDLAYMPVVFQKMTRDGYGIIKSFVDATISFTEQTRTYSSDIRRRLSDSKEQFDYWWSLKNVSNYFTPDMVMGGAFVKTYSPDLPTVKFLGTVEIPDSPGEFVHIVESPNGEKYEMPLHNIDGDELNDAVKRLYRDELINELMNGDTREITWVDKVDAAENQQIQDIFKQVNAREKLVAAEKMEKGDEELRFHQREYRGNEYRYVIIKSSEDPQSWKGVLVGHYNLKKDPKKKSLIKYFDNKKRITGEYDVSHKIADIPVLKNGFWKADDWGSGGEIINKRGINIKNSVDRQPISFKFMPRQPFAPFVARESRKNALNLWEYSSSLKNAFHDFAEDVIRPISRETQKSIEKSQLWLENNPKLAEKLGVKPSNTYTNEWGAQSTINPLVQLINHFDFNSFIYVGRDGEVVTRNSFFKAKKENYFPWMWDVDTMIDMLTDTISTMTVKAKEIEDLSEEEIDERHSAVNAIESQLEMVTNPDMEWEGNTQINIGSQAAMTKHRKMWTDPTLRRKDENVVTDYISKTTHALASQKLYAQALESLIAIAKTSEGRSRDGGKWRTDEGLFEAQTEFIVERLKLAMNDPTAIASMPVGGKKDLHYDAVRVSEWLNKRMEATGSKRRFTPRSAQRLIRTQRAIFSAQYLGAPQALVNKTQSSNSIINLSFDLYKRARRIRKNGMVEHSRGELAGMDWGRFIDDSGVTEMVTAFADAVADVDDVNFGDRAFSFWGGLFNSWVPGMRWIPAKAMKKFVAMNWYSEDAVNAFINNGQPEIDTFLRLLENGRLVKYRDMKQALKNVNVPKEDKAAVARILSAIHHEFGKEQNYNQRRQIKVLRKTFLDLIMTPKDDNTREILEKKFKLLLGRVSDNRMEKMVAYKLSYWFNAPVIGGLEKYFTFTEGEKEMREDGVITTLLYAYLGGVLGDRGKAIERTYTTKFGKKVKYTTYECFETDTAKRLARATIRNEYYGMTKAHMGRAFAGAGDSIWQYKGYALQQTLHDWRIFNRMEKGTKLERLHNELGNVWHEVNNRIEYNPNDPAVDEYARQGLRFLATRGMATAGAIVAETIPFSKFGMLTVGRGGNINSFVSGAENPLLKVAVRLLVYGFWFMSDIGDDEKPTRGVTRSAWNVLRLFFPLYFGILANVAEGILKFDREFLDD